VVFRSGIDLILPPILFFLFLLLGRPLQKAYEACPFKSDWDEIWQDCSSSKYASIDRIGFLVWRHTFKMAVMTTFHAEKCCHLVNAHSVCSATLYQCPLYYIRRPTCCFYEHYGAFRAKLYDHCFSDWCCNCVCENSH